MFITDTISHRYRSSLFTNTVSVCRAAICRTNVSLVRSYTPHGVHTFEYYYTNFVEGYHATKKYYLLIAHKWSCNQLSTTALYHTMCILRIFLMIFLLLYNPLSSIERTPEDTQYIISHVKYWFCARYLWVKAEGRFRSQGTGQPALARPSRLQVLPELC